jgi:hypothetical protein
VADVAVRAKQRILAHEAAIGFLPGLASGRRWRRGCGSAEEFTSKDETVGFDAVGEEAEMAHANEAPGDDVTQKAPDEFQAAQGEGLSAAAVSAILVAESYSVQVMGDDAFIADGDSMGVAAEIAQDLFGSGHGGLGIDNEFLNGSATQQEEARGLRDAQTALDESGFKRLEEFPSKDHGEFSDRQKEPRSGCDPLSAIEAQSSTGRDAVDMREIPELLIPGVENGDEARRGSEVTATHVDHGLRCGLEQKGVGGARIATEERMETGRESEDLVKVRDGQQVVDLGLDPEGLVQALTLGAVSIAAGVIDGSFTSAVIASLFVSAQGRGATRGERLHHPGLVVAEWRKIMGVGPEDVSQFRPHLTRP